MIIVCRAFTGSSTPRSTTPTRSPRRCGGPRCTGPRNGSSGSSSSSACWPGWSGSSIRHPLLDVAAGVLVLAWYQAGWPGVIAAVTSAARVPGHCADHVAGLVHPAGHGPGPVPVALVVVLPAPLAGGADHRRARPDVPGPGHPAGPRQGPGRAVRGPGDGAAGVGAVAEAVRRPGRGTGARVRRALLPGPHRPARAGWCWSSSAATPWPR